MGLCRSSRPGVKAQSPTISFGFRLFVLFGPPFTSAAGLEQSSVCIVSTEKVDRVRFEGMVNILESLARQGFALVSDNHPSGEEITGQVLLDNKYA